MFNFKSLFGKNSIEEKAFNQNTSLWQLLMGSGSDKVYSPKELLKYNFGWVAACLNKNAQTLSSIPIRLYYKKENGQSLKASKHKILKKEIQLAVKTSSKKSFTELVEITEHQVLDLIERPNSRMNWTDFVILNETYLGLIGNSYIYMEKEGDKITGLYPLLSENVSIKVKENAWGYGDIQNYLYSKDGVESHSFPPEAIIHMLNSSPGSVLYGKGELEQCLSAAERELYYDQTENYLNRNNARPDFLVSYVNGIKENEQKELMKMWYKKFGSVQNSGKPLVASGDVKVQQLGFNPREMQYKTGRDAVRQEIASVFGVPEALLVINESNFASSKSATNHYVQFTIKPKLTRFLEKLNEQFVSVYDDRLFLWWDGEFNSSMDALETAQLDQIYLTNGVYNPDYVRSRMGIEGIVDDEETVVNEETETPVSEGIPNEE
jgi:HK97 family phage portal protein